MNYLYLGDCLNVLRDNIKVESIDLNNIDLQFLQDVFYKKLL